MQKLPAAGLKPFVPLTLLLLQHFSLLGIAFFVTVSLLLCLLSLVFLSYWAFQVPMSFVRSEISYDNTYLKVFKLLIWFAIIAFQ